MKICLKSREGFLAFLTSHIHHHHQLHVCYVSLSLSYFAWIAHFHEWSSLFLTGSKAKGKNKWVMKRVKSKLNQKIN